MLEQAVDEAEVAELIEAFEGGSARHLLVAWSNDYRAVDLSLVDGGGAPRSIARGGRTVLGRSNDNQVLKEHSGCGSCQDAIDYLAND